MYVTLSQNEILFIIFSVSIADLDLNVKLVTEKFGGLAINYVPASVVGPSLEVTSSV